MVDLRKMCRNARRAARILSGLDRKSKDRALITLADMLISHQADIIDANSEDIRLARDAGLIPALIDRLRLNEGRITNMAVDLHAVTGLDDPVGSRFDQKELPNGLRIFKQRVPIGVLAVIYESRPNVTIDVSSLALKSGNASILRGGKETLHSNRALIRIIDQAFERCDIPPGAVQFIDSSDRTLVMELLQMYESVDMLIPRGGAGLHKFCRENSRIPVITGGIGICHLFIDQSADQSDALKILHNAKTQRRSVCNALDTVLVHKTIAGEFIPKMITNFEGSGVKFRLDSESLEHMPENLFQSERIRKAGKDDFDTEWLSLVLGVRVVTDVVEAVDHIYAHSTGHSDGILTQDEHNANYFVAQVDSAAVYVNASTRFTDGAQLGLGAEVAISTQRLHARGPMALEALTTYKWVIKGDGHVRA